ncbi:MAG: alpha-amylase family glycosyl hydrolase [Clostridia bacterium]|nr:alpha-amylase family glycosyl hydrolase [Clostridia bacterium]
MVKWLENAVFYEIYPQSFYDTNGDGIGDLQGIIEKLDYIKSIGCNALWINPCFDSPFQDAGYDVRDYYKIAPRYGTNDDAKHLFDEVHKRDMHVLLDLVPGHTSIEHEWFKQSAKAEKNEYTDRFIWTSNVWQYPTNIRLISGLFERDGNAVINFFSSQPALNYGYYEPRAEWEQPMDAPGPKATLEEMKRIMAFWLDMGCDGFRVDMAASLVKNDEQRIGVTKLWHNVRAFLDEKFPQAVLVSEWGEPHESLNAGFHMDFLLHFGESHYTNLYHEKGAYFSKDATLDSAAFIKTYKSYMEKTAGKGYICLPTGNHDMVRLSNFVDAAGQKLAFAFQMSMPGCPFIYYGDEIAMNYQQLVNKEGGYFRTGSRTPMQWNNEKNFGFSSAEAEMLYLPTDPSENAPCVAAQENDPDSMLNTVRDLIAIRKANPALQNGGSVTFLTEGGYPLVYLRENAGQRILVLVNPSADAVTYKTDLVGEKIYEFGTVSYENGAYHIGAQSAAFIVL